MTSVNPITEKVYKDKSKRLVFNRKFERTRLPLLLVKFDGVIGYFSRDDIFSDT